MCMPSQERHKNSTAFSYCPAVPSYIMLYMHDCLLLFSSGGCCSLQPKDQTVPVLESESM